jgi:hypothetical protein
MSVINYGYRHIREYWWPLYRGVLSTVTRADIRLRHFAAFMFPMTAAAVAWGHLPLRSVYPGPEPEITKNGSAAAGGCFVLLRYVF